MGAKAPHARLLLVALIASTHCMLAAAGGSRQLLARRHDDADQLHQAEALQRNGPQRHRETHGAFGAKHVQTSGRAGVSTGSEAAYAPSQHASSSTRRLLAPSGGLPLPPLPLPPQVTLDDVRVNVPGIVSVNVKPGSNNTARAGDEDVPPQVSVTLADLGLSPPTGRRRTLLHKPAVTRLAQPQQQQHEQHRRQTLSRPVSSMQLQLTSERRAAARSSVQVTAAAAHAGLLARQLLQEAPARTNTSPPVPPATPPPPPAASPSPMPRPVFALPAMQASAPTVSLSDLFSAEHRPGRRLRQIDGLTMAQQLQQLQQDQQHHRMHAANGLRVGVEPSDGGMYGTTRRQLGTGTTGRLQQGAQASRSLNSFALPAKPDPPHVTLDDLGLDDAPPPG